MNELIVQTEDKNSLSVLVKEDLTSSIPQRVNPKDVFFTPKTEDQLFFLVGVLPYRVYRLWVKGLDISKCFSDGVFELEKGIARDPAQPNKFLTIKKGSETKIASYPFIMPNSGKLAKSASALLRESYPELSQYLLLNDAKNTHESSLENKKFATDVQDAAIMIFYNVKMNTPQIAFIHQRTFESNINVALKDFKEIIAKGRNVAKYPLIKARGYDEATKSYPLTLVTDREEVSEITQNIDTIRGKDWFNTYFESKEFFEQADKIFQNGYPEF